MVAASTESHRRSHSNTSNNLRPAGPSQSSSLLCREMSETDCCRGGGCEGCWGGSRGSFRRAPETGSTQPMQAPGALDYSAPSSSSPRGPSPSPSVALMTVTPVQPCGLSGASDLLPHTPASASSLLPGGVPGSSGDNDDMDPSCMCALCFERRPDVGIGGCGHRMCSTCAGQMCARVTDRPLACP